MVELKNLHVGFIGYGRIAEIMVSRLVRGSFVAPENIIMTGPRIDRCLELSEKYNVRTSMENLNALEATDIVVLAVKPQTIPKILLELRKRVNMDNFPIIISVAAGVPIEEIGLGIGSACLRIVRAMPNTPSYVGAGVTVWTSNSNLSLNDFDTVKQFFSAFGREIALKLEDQGHIDKVTALSGSGPAYVFYFMESMIKGGTHIGLPRGLSMELVTQVVLGSVEYFIERSKDNDVHLAQLRDEVTSPAGTTDAAMLKLEEAGFTSAIIKAVEAAFERSRVLGQAIK